MQWKVWTFFFLYLFRDFGIQSLCEFTFFSFSLRNGLLQTSLDITSHSKMNGMQDCRELDFCPAGFSKGVKGAPLTNGHVHLFNGALKSEDLSLVTGPFSSNRDMSKCQITRSTGQPQSPPNQTNADPYEFPPSPPKQSDLPPGFLEHPCTQGDNGHKPPLPTSHEAANKVHLLPECLHPHSQVTATSEQTHPPPSSWSILESSVRLNGSHHDAFSSDLTLLSTTSTTAKPDPPTIETSPKTSELLLEQTGGLISEYYSHSRLHQISTWRVGFSEYVNELHSKRKATGVTSYPGKDRLRKFVAQRSTDGQGKTERFTLLFLSMNFFHVLSMLSFFLINTSLFFALKCPMIENSTKFSCLNDNTDNKVILWNG